MVLGILAPLGMLALCGLMLLDLRRDAWDKAEQTSRNLLQVLDRDIARNIEIIDLSLRAVVDNLKVPGVADLNPTMRQLVLFDRAASARDMGVMLVLDENGDSIHDGNVFPARHVNNADRDYFQAHRANPSLGLLVSRPVLSKIHGVPVLVLSRRIDKPDGSFGGVVLGTLKVSYFASLFEQIALGREGAINLYHRDGTRIMRHPRRDDDVGANLAGTPNFERFVGERTGSFVGLSVRDSVTRLYAFGPIGDFPMLLNVALSVDEIEGAWRAKAVVIGLVVLALCGLTIGLSTLFGRELRRRVRMQAELAKLSRTDGLTGLQNRRRFDEIGQRVWRSALRSRQPFSLLVIDADHFKRYNDRYGHSVGDEILKSLGGALSRSGRRPDDFAFRIGGEEFAMLLADTDEAGAMRVAEMVHRNVAGLSVPSADIAAGTVTVSIGLASTIPAAPDGVGTLYRNADAALYRAKEGGRNQTRCAPAVIATKALSRAA